MDISLDENPRRITQKENPEVESRHKTCKQLIPTVGLQMCPKEVITRLHRGQGRG